MPSWLRHAVPTAPPQVAALPPERSRQAVLQTELAEAGDHRNNGPPRNYRVWLGTVETEAQARWEWERLVDNHPRSLALTSADAELVVSERGHQGWRIYAGRFETMQAASAFCARLRLDDRFARCTPYRDAD
ncbi:SPOR domain-containing protein [Stella sp.]|uniref:SPOR domain-containing protein n=1 Tax=Stella sp. TaxID=2912054 RepID=UPI0035B1D99D